MTLALASSEITAEIPLQVNNTQSKSFLHVRNAYLLHCLRPECSWQISDAYLNSDNNMNNLFLTTMYKIIKFLSSRHIANQLMFSSISYGKRKKYGIAANFFYIIWERIMSTSIWLVILDKKNDNCLVYLYSRLPITRTLAHSNLAPTRTKKISVIHLLQFSASNSNPR